MEEILQQCTKTELVALINQMVSRYPDLELLVLRSAIGEDKRPAVDPAMIRRQVDNIFYDAEDDHQSAYDISWELQDVVLKVGNDYAEQKDWHNAAVVYETIAREVLDNYEMVYDHDGDLSDLVNDCVSGLGRCLDGTEDSAQRETFLRALFDIYCWDVNYGGVGIGDEVPAIILERATPEEQERVAEWVRNAMPKGDDQRSTWHREHFGSFLIKLDKDRLDDETFLDLCRQTGQRRELMDRLLSLGRVDEAISEIRQESDSLLLSLAELFVSHGYGSQVEKLIRERAQTSRGTRLIEWLKDWAKAQGDLEQALSLMETLFWNYPSLAGYREYKNLAQTSARWEGAEGLGAVIRARLTEASKYALLTEIHLEEGEIDGALEMLGRVRIASRGLGQPLRIQVARAAERERPQAAVDLYMQQVEQLVEARGRRNYAGAAKYLCRIRDLYQRLGELETWKTLYDDLRTRHRRLQAFQDELKKTGL
jgi:GNAT superfamily N-acetyltransferase